MTPAEYAPIPEIPPSRRDAPPPRRSGAGRILAVVLIAGVIAALLAFGIGSMQGTPSVKLSPVDGDTTGEVVDQMNGLIEDNTK